ncbi:MAG: hypothetical protein ACLQHF_08125 [Terracidiphilus sp.]
MMYKIKFQILALMLLVFVSFEAHAQIVGATISGTVKDATSAALSGAQPYSSLALAKLAAKIDRGIKSFRLKDSDFAPRGLRT